MKPRPHRTTNLLAAAVVMIAAWIACDRALALALDSATTRSLIGAVVAAIVGALVLSRTGPSGSWSAISQARDVMAAMRRGDFSGRVPVPGRSALAPLAVALNELAADLGKSTHGTKKELDLLNGILDGMPEGVIVFDRRGHVVLANLAARRIAISGDDILGKSAIEALRNATLAEAVQRALTSGQGSARELEIGGVMPRRLLVRLSERAGEESGGGVIAVLHDVTDLRRLETIRTDFVSNVSHELRTPVTAITTAAETLLTGALDDRNDAAEFVEIIDRNARRLRRLVEDILDLSKIEGKAYKLAPALHDLAPVFAHAKKLVHDAAGRRRMKIIVHGGAGAAAWIDRHAFDQVLGNLLDNAVKYAGDGATVTVTARTEAAATVVRISDTGAGIPPQHLERLFERFYRVDAGRSREVGGTGLGLSIVKHLVEAMNGTIAVESALGKGTTFTVVVPRSAPTDEGGRTAPVAATNVAAPVPAVPESAG